MKNSIGHHRTGTPLPRYGMSQTWDLTVQGSDWVRKISAYVLHQRGKSLEGYIDSITTPGVPLDAITLLIVACLYKLHTGIFTAEGVWSTCIQRTPKKYDFYCCSSTPPLGHVDTCSLWRSYSLQVGQFPVYGYRSLMRSRSHIKVKVTSRSK